jgi:hypothetical protein
VGFITGCRRGEYPGVLPSRPENQALERKRRCRLTAQLTPTRRSAQLYVRCMSANRKLLWLPFWLGVLLTALGYVILYPLVARLGCFLIAAGLSAGAVFITRRGYPIGASGENANLLPSLLTDPFRRPFPSPALLAISKLGNLRIHELRIHPGLCKDSEVERLSVITTLLMPH